MEYPEVSGSPLTWSWVIEALAASREVELDLLCDLVDTFPKLFDNLNEAAREMIALRNLEDLYDPAKVLTNGVSSDGEGVLFDSSDCFSSVLQRVMDQPSVSSLRKYGSNPLLNARKVSDKLMRDIHAFIQTRKASMPKCALRELSNILQNGNACHVTNLKREWNCLQNGNPQSFDLPPEKKLRYDSNDFIASREQSSAPLTTSQLHDCPVNAQSVKSLVHDNSNSFTVSTEKISATPLISSNVQDVPLDGHSAKSLPGRKLSHDSKGSIASTEQNSDPLISSDNNQSHPPSWMPAQSVGLLTWYPCDVSSEDDKKNGKNSSTPADTTELELDICIKCNKGGEVLICSGSSCPMVVHERCLGFSLSIDNRDAFLCPFCVCSSAKSKYAEAKEKMLLAREKLSLFVAGNPDHLSKGFTNVNSNLPRQGVDVRALKGKDVHHVGWASTGEQNEGHGAQNEVQTSPNCSCKKGEEDVTAKSSQLERTCTIVNTSPSRQDRDERTLKGKGVYKVDGTSIEKQHEGHVAQENVHTSPFNCSPKVAVEDMTVKNCQLDEEFTDANANPPRQSRDERPSKGKGVYQAHQASADQQHKCHLVKDNVLTLPPKSSFKEGENITEKKVKQPMPIEHFHYAGSRGDLYELRPRKQFDNLSKNASCAFSGQLKGTPEAKNHTANPFDNNLTPQSRQRLPDRKQGASDISLDDCDEMSQEETSRNTSSKSPQRVKSPHFARYLGRPMRVPWTEEEVEMLKEGMKRFGSKDMKIIPWTTILEFGSNVFWKGRTGVNLKDKWRNLVKANPNLR